MPALKLTYFDFDGGRGEPIRIALHAASMEFEDHRISFQNFTQVRATLPFSCVPVLAIDGVDVTQSNTLDHVPVDLVDRLAPTLVEHQARVAADPVVAGYYASRNKAAT